MQYLIKLNSYNTTESAQASISRALGFSKELSHSALIDIFAKDIAHKNGVFTSKKRAEIVASAINKRGAFGGFGKFAITATVRA